ncbi:hypothetical protein QTP70_031102 [Hemibagrus guttatus]|uniref:Reverse transcriptase/retrotransposon-derived protein RNase H-like domain-containing protein n=1 Tax=Hemibagrus guttatus TaxID=175788 RepID=A0AAE0QRJ4_9TELE|nr:hypothetical protein QTP70_031102 [Hemibagrus guttatus]
MENSFPHHHYGHYELYVKLEKCEFHRSTISFLGYVPSPEGVAMDQVKVKAVTDWPELTSAKELQRFLVFANFYCRFIRNYSTIAGPLPSLLRGKPKKLSWISPAGEAFTRLKQSFTTAPILRHPDPETPFVVEVDASNSGVGVVLSLRERGSGKLHPCTFYLRKLTAAEKDYDIGNRELLSIKAALEECSVTYCPGSKNSKADAMSRLQEAPNTPAITEPILQHPVILGPVQWNLLEEVREANAEEPPLPACPPSKLYVPPTLHPRIPE